MDTETLQNCFVACFKSIDGAITKTFIVHELINNFVELREFLLGNVKNKEWHVSYNGLAFDAQLTEYIIDNNLSYLSPSDIAYTLYREAQTAINNSNSKSFQKYSPSKLRIQQIDLFKLNHWDNPAKLSSLKWIQYSMDWWNILDMPIEHTSIISTQKELDIIVEYCLNDVESTRQILLLSKEQVLLRSALSKEYGVNLHSASEPRIAKEILLDILSNEMDDSKWNIRQYKTNRTSIEVKDIILPYIKFTIPEFQKIHNQFLNCVIDPSKLKNAFKFIAKYKNVTTEFGLGGIHGCISPGIYASDEEKIIVSADVKSYYPNLAIKNRYAPAHFPKEVFCDTYESLYIKRAALPKSDPKNYVYKIILNSIYGLSLETNSFLYDPLVGMSITINGQLSLLLLYEMLSLTIPEGIPLMQNTDGLEMIIPRNKKHIYDEVCAKWEQITKLELEHFEYSKMFIRDVNNYIALYTDPKKEPKCKGEFEFQNLALHKNKSFLVIRKAVYEYFVNGTLPETYLKTNTNIFDYCAGIKAKSGWKFVANSLENGMLKQDYLQKTVRYYVSNKGSKLFKYHSDGRTQQIVAGNWYQTVYNVHENQPFEKYNINLSYYIEKIYDEISNLLGNSNQFKLF